MPLMSSLYVGSSGLRNSQNALNTTAHNLSNIDTVGYTRQQVQLSTKPYITLSKDPNSVGYKQYGLGVSYSNVKQVRDYFLDKTYRKESGRSMFYEVTTDALEEVESLLGEMDGEAFQTAVTDLWTAVQELAKDPTNTVTQALLVRRASELIERADSVYDGLTSYQDNLNQQIKVNINKVNQYGKAVAELNDMIRAIEGGGIEHANDLRDTRNQLLDELAQLTKISWKEDKEGAVSIQIEGVDFVKGSNCYEIGLQADDVTGFYTPFWPQNSTFTTLADGTRKYDLSNGHVFNLDLKISSDLDTDIGGIRAMLYARGDHRADFSDIISGDYDNVSQSLMMNIQAEFDQLLHNMIVKINDILAEAAGLVEADPAVVGQITLEDGTILSTPAELKGVRYCISEPEGYMHMDDGRPLQMFTKVASDGYQKATMTDADGVEHEIWIYNEEDLSASETLYTIKNVQLNEALMQSPSLLSFELPDETMDIATINALKEAFTEEIYTLNPNVEKKTTFVDYYTDLVSQVATNGYIYRSIYTNQASTVEATAGAREQIVGVSSDEELSNMIRFQNAFNASSRYVNVISEMLEHVIVTLGR